MFGPDELTGEGTGILHTQGQPRKQTPLQILYKRLFPFQCVGYPHRYVGGEAFLKFNLNRSRKGEFLNGVPQLPRKRE